MATTNQKTQEEVRKENIEATVSKTEKFLNENQKTIWTVLIAILVIGLAVLAYSKFIYTPKCAEAMAAAYPAEASFQAGEYELALNGDGNVAGFEQIISDYGTKAGKLASYYAGISYMKLGNYSDAINYLKKFDGNDQVIAPMALGAIGDCYMELDDMNNAVSYYGKAAAKNPNDFTSPMFLLKEGMTYEIMGNYAKALEVYKSLKKDFPMSNEAFDINRNIANLEEKLK